jgi:hypothetical protein
MVTQRAGQQPGQRGQDRSVWPRQPRLGHLTAQDRDLVAQDKDLDVWLLSCSRVARASQTA